MSSFRDFLNEGKEFYVIALDDKTYLSDKFKFTGNIQRAYVFPTFNDAIAYEERNSNKIDGYTEIYKVKDNKFTLMT